MHCSSHYKAVIMTTWEKACCTVSLACHNQGHKPVSSYNSGFSLFLFFFSWPFYWLFRNLISWTLIILTSLASQVYSPTLVTSTTKKRKVQFVLLMHPLIKHPLASLLKKAESLPTHTPARSHQCWGSNEAWDHVEVHDPCLANSKGKGSYFAMVLMVEDSQLRKRGYRKPIW